MAAPNFLGTGSTPNRNDTKWFILQRILGKLTDGVGGGLSGSGSPEGSVAGNVGQTYWDYTNKILWTKDSGAGTVNGWYQTVG
jgi:hypothetical protein